jgi:hypothetical protein
MKKSLLINLLLCLLLSFVSCSSESTKTEEEIIEGSTRYYVKYVIGTQYIEAEGELINDKNEVVYFKGNGEYVYGPVEKGFRAYMKITNANRKTVGQILVSINQEPFTIKESQETYGQNFEISYKIE